MLNCPCCRSVTYRAVSPDAVLEAHDILYVAGELDVVEYFGEEFGLGLVTQVGLECATNRAHRI